MAFSKSLHLPSGYAADCIRLRPYRIDPDKRQAFAVFKIYKDAAAAADGAAPATHQVIKLRLSGRDYDAFFGKAAKATATAAGLTIDDAAILYRAAKARPDLTWSDWDREDPEQPGKVIRPLESAVDT